MTKTVLKAAASILAAMTCLGLSVDVSLAQADDIECTSGAGFCVVNSTGLPLRLLAKPQSNIYADMDETSSIVEANVPAFSVLIAFETVDVNYDANNFATEGWFKVGTNTTDVLGYMMAKDVVEWKQALALAYTNPGAGTGRNPVLMFGDKDSLEATIKDIDEQAIDPAAMYQEIYAGNTPEGIVSREPDAYVDINDTFYLLPILATEDLSAYRADGGDMMGLQVAAVTQAARGSGTDACDLQSSEATECLDALAGEGAGDLRLDVVFVIDMTSSMQPHIEAVTEAVREASQTLFKYLPDETRLKFGLVGYRDSIAVTPDLEFVSKNFTPDLITGPEFAAMVTGEAVRASATGSDDWAEEVFAGMLEGLNSNWSPNAARVIVLVGDASSHGLEHPSNTTQMTEVALRQLADENSVYIAAIYIGEGESADASLARPQFEAVSMNSNGESAFAIVTGAGAAEELMAELKRATDGIIQAIGKGDINAINSGTLGGAGTGAGAAMAGAVRAAFVDYIGQDAQPPTNLVAWVSDQDLADTSTKALEVKVVLRKSDLQELMQLLDSLMKAYRGGNQTTGGFFGGLQGGSAATSFDLGIAETEQFINTDIVPKWIKALPYKSEVLNYSIEAFRNFSPDDKTRFETRIETLINLYDDILNRNDAWVALNDKGSVDDEINMLDLSNLP